MSMAAHPDLLDLTIFSSGAGNAMTALAGCPTLDWLKNGTQVKPTLADKQPMRGNLNALRPCCETFAGLVYLNF